MDRMDWKRWNADVVGAGLFLTVALAGYGLFVHRPLNDALHKASATENLHHVRRSFDSLQNTFTLQQRKIDNVRERLDGHHAALLRPRTADGFLSNLNEIAGQCGVEVTRWQPTGVQEYPGYQAEGFLVEGRASFPAVHRWLALIEAGAPFLDVTHFSIRSSDKDGGCAFECSLISYSATQTTEHVARATP